MEMMIPFQLDGIGVQEAALWFEEIASAEDDIVLDLSGVERLDGSGLGALMYVIKRKRALHHNLVIKNLSSQVREVLSKLGLIEFFESFPEVAEVDFELLLAEIGEPPPRASLSLGI